MSGHPIGIVITRTDGTQVRPPAGLWGDMTGYDFDPFHGFGVYLAVAAFAEGALKQDILWRVEDEGRPDTMAVLGRLVMTGFITAEPTRIGTRYRAQGLEDIR